MPVQTSYPGVYVQEVPSGVRTIAGVSTSVAMFIGRTMEGPLYEPTRCFNFSDFERNFSSVYAKSDLARSVRLFFQNGGTQCYVTRVADSTAGAAEVTLNSEGAAPVLTATAKSAGVTGNEIRISVNYSTVTPEETFNMEVFRWKKQGDRMVKTSSELFTALSMNPDSARYAPDVVTQNSNLIKLEKVAAMPAAGTGYSLSGRPLPNKTAAMFTTSIKELIGTGYERSCFQIGVNGMQPITIDLNNIDLDAADMAAEFENVINPKLLGGASVTVTFEGGPNAQGDGETTCQLRFAANLGDVKILPAAERDLAVPAMLGTGQGGIEVSSYADLRPAPTGIFMKRAELTNFSQATQGDLTSILVGGRKLEKLPAKVLQTCADAEAPIFKDNYSPSPTATGNNDGVREKLYLIAKAVTEQKSSEFKWTAEVWGSRLALIPGDGEADSQEKVTSTGADLDLETVFESNVRYYRLGATAGSIGNFQHSDKAGSDGGKPGLTNYQEAFKIIDAKVDIFNLMVLPKDEEHTKGEISSIRGAASTFCLKRRAFLLLDGPDTWTSADKAVELSAGVNELRTGLVKDYSAVFYPRLVINEDGREVKVGPSGAIAGLIARTDGTRGVWKAPAGTEADIRGVTALEYKFSDDQNGIMNPRGVNTLRVFPNGIVNWGARTLDGDDDFGSEYKYIPIRRLALYIEESLYRGLKWVVFEPNDEPLWSQIRLNAGAFMHNLFRQGAFQGAMPKDAYFVKCDAETTPQNDRDLGRVNIWVGFAPLKPAEFVIISLQQMAGQIQV